MTFTKLFSSITESTIWVESAETRLTWITMLAMADRKGRVWASIPGLANRARVSVEGCEAAIRSFLAPDKHSRTKEQEGRRIEEIDGGWRLLNYEKYRAIRDQEATREQTAARVRRHRKKRNVTLVTPSNDNAEAEADIGSTTVDPLLWQEFADYRKSIRKPLTALSAKKNIAILERLTPEQRRQSVDTTIANNWTGLFPPKGHGNGSQPTGPRSAVDRVKAAAAARAVTDQDH